MEKKKIVMISPGQANETNTGLGVATYFIKKYLSHYCEVTAFNQNNEKSLSQIKTTNSESKSSHTLIFKESDIISELTHIYLDATIAPFEYFNEEQAQTSVTVSTKVKEKLNIYTQEIVHSLKNSPFDAVYAHDWMSIKAGLALKEKLNIPLILHIHSLDIDRFSELNTSWIFDIEKEGMKKADCILAVSNYTAQRIIQFYDIPKAKIKVVHNGHEWEGIPKKKKKFEESLVLFVGRLSNQKGSMNFIEIAKNVLAIKPNARFVMAGEGHLYADLIESVSQKNIGDRFHFTGFLTANRMKEVYKMADIFCMPSVSEPFGLVALEAASFGLPLVLSSQSGVSEVLPNVLLANHWQYEDFAQHIVSLIENKDNFKDNMIKENFAALKNLTWEKVAKEIFNHILNQIQ